MTSSSVLFDQTNSLKDPQFKKPWNIFTMNTHAGLRGRMHENLTDDKSCFHSTQLVHSRLCSSSTEHISLFSPLTKRKKKFSLSWGYKTTSGEITAAVFVYKDNKKENSCLLHVVLHLTQQLRLQTLYCSLDHTHSYTSLTNALRPVLYSRHNVHHSDHHSWTLITQAFVIVLNECVWY